MTVAELTDLINEQLASGAPLIDDATLRYVLIAMGSLEPEGTASIVSLSALINANFAPDATITSGILRDTLIAMLQNSLTGSATQEDLTNYINATLPDSSKLTPAIVKTVLLQMLQLVNPDGIIVNPNAITVTLESDSTTYTDSRLVGRSVEAIGFTGGFYNTGFSKTGDSDADRLASDTIDFGTLGEIPATTVITIILA